MAYSDDEKDDIYSEFYDTVNMAPKEIEDWLETDESKSVGQKKGGSNESVGHKSGKKIVKIKRKKKADITEGDYDHMKKVIGYINRHRAQKPKEVEGSDWAYSLKNWGYDPMK